MTDQAMVPVADGVNVTIDGLTVTVPKGTLVIRAAEQLGIEIPRFCDHPLLSPVGACRQCLVEVATPDKDGNYKTMPKPQSSCTLEATEGMQVKTAATSPIADKAQKGVIELLLANHPLDCPICDKGGECPLQDQAMAHGAAESRFIETKRTYVKPINVSPLILLDRERCVLCQRCTRFCSQIAGDPFIALQQRGASSQIGEFNPEVLGFEESSSCAEPKAESQDPSLSLDSAMPGGPQNDGVGAGGLPQNDGSFTSFFGGNTIQICPVGALTSAMYRFRARPFDLVSSDAIGEHDSMGSAIRIDHRRGKVLRRMAGNAPEVNEEWLTDKDRFAGAWQTSDKRVTNPLIRENGKLRPASWAEALEVAANGLAKARVGGGVGVLPGGRLTCEDAQAYAQFARDALQSEDVDYRSRISGGAEEAAWLTQNVAGSGLGVTFADVETAPAVLLVALEPEEEGGVLYLRLHKAVAKNQTRVFSLAPFASNGLTKLGGILIQTAPGDEVQVLGSLASTADPEGLDTATSSPTRPPGSDAAEALAQPGALILVGERLGAVPGGLAAAKALAEGTGARLAWIPRRVGERAAVEAGLLPGSNGRDLMEILHGLFDGSLGGAVVGGLELRDLPKPDAARAALAKAGFVVSLEVLASEVHQYADVILPVAPPAEKTGTYLNWEGRERPFGKALDSTALSDAQVLTALARQMGSALDPATPAAASAQDDGATMSASAQDTHSVGRVGPKGRVETTTDPEGLDTPAAQATRPTGTAVLASWHTLLDDGALQQGIPHLDAVKPEPVVRISSALAARLAMTDGELVGLQPMKWADGKAYPCLPVKVTESMLDGVAWVPTTFNGGSITDFLGLKPGDQVGLNKFHEPISETIVAPDLRADATSATEGRAS